MLLRRLKIFKILGASPEETASLIWTGAIWSKLKPLYKRKMENSGGIDQA